MTPIRLTYSPYALQNQPAAALRRLIKRVLDVAFSIAGIAILSPIFVCAAIAIKLDSPGATIFRQRRRGLHGKEFVIFKFRSMTVLEDGPVIKQARRDDQRVTRVGKFLRRTSIDELPQLVNVIKGDMSLVGPRPHALAHDDAYMVQIEDYTKRYLVKPGITGWAQVNGLRGETPSVEQMAKRIKYDLWYARQWSLAMDLAILFRTAVELVSDKAY